MPASLDCYKGTLITCDPPLREFILHLGEKRGGVVIRDLDATHVFVRTEHVEYIRAELERFRRQSSFETTIGGE